MSIRFAPTTSLSEQGDEAETHRTVDFVKALAIFSDFIPPSDVLQGGPV
jgi:hypothetical protein